MELGGVGFAFQKQTLLGVTDSCNALGGLLQPVHRARANSEGMVTVMTEPEMWK